MEGSGSTTKGGRQLPSWKKILETENEIHVSRRRVSQLEAEVSKTPLPGMSFADVSYLSSSQTVKAFPRRGWLFWNPKIIETSVEVHSHSVFDGLLKSLRDIFLVKVIEIMKLRMLRPSEVRFITTSLIGGYLIYNFTPSISRLIEIGKPVCKF